MNLKSLPKPLIVSVGVLYLSACSSPLKYEPRAQAFGNSSAQIPFESDKWISGCSNHYQIQAGDTLGAIARKCGVSASELARLNKIHRPDKIYIGQWLNIPQKTESTAADDIELGKLNTSNKPSFTKPNFTAKTLGLQENPKSEQITHWIWPVKARLNYRWKADNNGVYSLDIFGSQGEEISAVADGEVVYADSAVRQYGLMLMIRHADKLVIYAHNKQLLVKVGDKVQQGQKIALMGATGITAESKLHLETRFEGKKIDLKPLLSSP